MFKLPSTKEGERVFIDEAHEVALQAHRSAIICVHQKKHTYSDDMPYLIIGECGEDIFHVSSTNACWGEYFGHVLSLNRSDLAGRVLIVKSGEDGFERCTLEEKV